MQLWSLLHSTILLYAMQGHRMSNGAIVPAHDRAHGVRERDPALATWHQDQTADGLEDRRDGVHRFFKALKPHEQ